MLTIQQLNDLGIEVRPDQDQPGKFLWVHDQGGSELSFDTAELAQANASAYAKDVFTLSVCQNCEKMHSEENLAAIKDFEMRVSAGEKVPSGECPDCGALCHLYEEPKELPTAEPGSLQTTLQAIEGYLANKADHGDTLAANLATMLKPWLEPTLWSMSLNDSGVEFKSFKTEEDRIRFLAAQRDMVDDHYFIDALGEIKDIGLATVGPKALEDL